MISESIRSLLAGDGVRLFDVGAAGGFARRWRIFGDSLSARGVDALDPSFSSYGSVALADRYAVDQDFYHTRKSECSSLLRPNEEMLANFPLHRQRFDVVERTTLDTFTADYLIDSGGLGPDFRPDVMKVDVQGAALQVLKGSQKALRDSVKVVEVELEFAPLYQGDPSFSPVHDFLRFMGFELLSINPVVWSRRLQGDPESKSGRLVFCDALYTKSKPHGPYAKDAVRRHVAILLAYGCMDEAEALIREHGLQHLTSISSYRSPEVLRELLTFQLFFNLSSVSVETLLWFTAGMLPHARLTLFQELQNVPDLPNSWVFALKNVCLQCHATGLRDRYSKLEQETTGLRDRCSKLEQETTGLRDRYRKLEQETARLRALKAR